MEHDRWSWFAGGVVLGLLIGAGIAGGYGMTKLAEARAETELERAETELERMKATPVHSEADVFDNFAARVQGQTLDFYHLDFATARKLDGKRVRVRFTPHSRAALLDTGETIVEAFSEPPQDSDRYRSTLLDGLGAGSRSVPPAERTPGELACVRFAKGVQVPDLDVAVHSLRRVTRPEMISVLCAGLHDLG